ncbi:hypothetical protein MMC26_003096 [Xylographa opegraphella]|nr:hypothetical protein [Xylographa opegraphella]
MELVVLEVVELELLGNDKDEVELEDGEFEALVEIADDDELGDDGKTEVVVGTAVDTICAKVSSSTEVVVAVTVVVPVATLTVRVVVVTTVTVLSAETVYVIVSAEADVNVYVKV